MFSQSRADYHIFSIDGDQSPVIFGEQLGLRCNQSANSRNSYNASMQMVRKVSNLPPRLHKYQNKPGCVPGEYEKLPDQVFRIFPADPVLQKALPKLFIKRSGSS